MIRQLVWKEWRMLRWKLVFSLVLVGGYEVIAFKTRIVEDLGIYIMGVMMTLLLMPVFTAMGLFAAEREESSLAFQVVLPVRARTIYMVKMALGAIVTATPLLFAMLIALLTRGRELNLWEVFRGGICGMLTAVFIFIWITVLSIRCRSEAFVAVSYVGLMSVWLFVSTIDEPFFYLIPLSVVNVMFNDPLYQWWILAGQILFATGFFIWGMKRFDKLAGRLS